MADGSVTIQINVDGKDVEVKLDDLKKKISDVEGSANKATEQSTRDAKALALAMGGVAASLTAAGLKAYEMSSQFGTAFAKTKTIMDSNVVSSTAMRNAILALSKDSAMAATDVSEAVYQAISGSVDTADAVQFVDNANKLAVAGFTSLTNATNVLTTTLNAYHLSAEKVEGISNVLIRTQNLGKTSVDELSVSMGKAIATGSAYNVDLQNLSTAYVELTRNGIATAESTTYINSMLNELGDSGKTVGKIISEQTGRSFGQLMQEGWSLGDVLNVLLQSVDGNSEALMGLWGSAEAGKAANAIVSQSIEDFNVVLGQMNQEIAGATNTTASAYETMTSTSEFIDRRLNNSVTNLAIAYGDSLAPALDTIKSAGADVIEWLTGLIESSPAAAAAVAGLSTGVVILAGGLAALMIIEKVKKAFKSFDILLSASPIMLAVAGVAALAVGIASLSSATEEENTYLKSFNENLDNLKGGMERSVAATDVAVNQVQSYVDRLNELETTGLKTTEQQAEYHEILVKLTETIPELASIIDLETDSINGGTAAVEANTAAWAENQRAAAYREYLAEIDAAYTNALIEQEAAQIRVRDAMQKREEAERTASEMELLMDEIEHQGGARAEEYSESVWELIRAHEDLLGPVSSATDAYMAVRDAYDDATEALENADAELSTAQQKYEDATVVVGECTKELDVATEAVNNLSTSVEEAGETIETAGEQIEGTTARAVEIKALAPEIAESLQAWAEKYGELYQAAKDSLEKQFKLWEEAENVTAVSVSKANQGIQSQIDYWHRYNDDLTTIKDSNIAGLDQLYSYISDGSTDSVAMAAGIADAIRSGNEPAVEEMVALYEELAATQSSTADSMLQMQTDMDQALRDLVGSVDGAIGDMEMDDSAWTAAHLTVLAYARGLYDGTASVENAARSVANAAARAMGGASTSSSARSGSVRQSAYASGTSYATAGYALVGEEGPELIYLRGGERILSADETKSALQGAFHPGTSAATYSTATAPLAVGGGPAAERHITITVPIAVDGHELARVTAEAMGEEMLFSGQ